MSAASANSNLDASQHQQPQQLSSQSNVCESTTANTASNSFASANNDKSNPNDSNSSATSIVVSEEPVVTPNTKMLPSVSATTRTATPPSTKPSLAATIQQQQSHTTSLPATFTPTSNLSANSSTAPNSMNMRTTSATNGSLSESLVSNDGHRTPNIDNLSKTNLYIRGLQPTTSDQDLYNMCARFGNISSTKAISDKDTGLCKGYGFVQFITPQSAEIAVQELTKSGVQAQMARLSPVYASRNQHHPHHQHHHQSGHQQHHYHNSAHSNSSCSSSSNTHNNNHINSQMHNQGSMNRGIGSNSNNSDPTNLYIANLPINMTELELENLLLDYGPVVSTRILRDESNNPRGVGFARMESRDKCQEIIDKLNGKPFKGSKDPLLVKFADGGNKKRHHHNNQHHNNNHHQQHHKMHQDDNRWREAGNPPSDLNNMSNFDQQGNIPHSNQLSDLAMMGAMGYPRMQSAFPPAVAQAAAAYPTAMGPPTSAPQWIHPGGPGQPWNVIQTQQILQAGPPANHSAASNTFPFNPMSQLTAQIQGLHIAHHHPGAPVGGYHIQPQHPWSQLWHQIPPQQAQPPSMRIAPMQHQMQPPPPQQALSQESSQPLSSSREQSGQSKPLANDNKLQVSAPLL